MFELKLTAKQCICCGICMDVCDRRALEMRVWRGRTLEGPRLALSSLPASGEAAPLLAPQGTFPYLAHPALCDGCRRCVVECPVSALDITARNRPAVAGGGRAADPMSSPAM